MAPVGGDTIDAADLMTAVLLSTASYKKVMGQGHQQQRGSDESSAVGRMMMYVPKAHADRRCAKLFERLKDLHSFGERKGVNGVLAWDPQGRRCWVVFRGTCEVQGGLADCDTRMVEMPGCPGKVHGGFAAQLTAALPVIAKYLEGKPGVGRVHVAGHSLGGALATLFTAYLMQQGVPATAMVFGCPRAGNEDFAAKFEQGCAMTSTRLIRFATTWKGEDGDLLNDRVTNLPSSSLGYKHVGEHFLLPLSSQLPANWQVISRKFAQHATNHYLQAVSDLVNSSAHFNSALACLAHKEMADDKVASKIQQVWHFSLLPKLRQRPSLESPPLVMVTWWIVKVLAKQPDLPSHPRPGVEYYTPEPKLGIGYHAGADGVEEEIIWQATAR